MNPWIPVIVSFLGQLLIAAYVYGQLKEKSENSEKAIVSLQESDNSQWQAISEVRSDVSRIEGQLAPRQK